jgi:hypothetical protein
MRRGWLSFLTIEPEVSTHRTGLFVASAELDVIQKVRPALVRRWPTVEFTFLAPEGYADEFGNESEVLWLEQLKLHPLKSLVTLRRRKFDLCVVMTAGRRTFRKLKVSTLWLNARRTVVYNENGDSIVMDRAHWKQMCAYVAYRVRRWRPVSFFYPIGFIYLSVRTFWLVVRSRFVGRKAY